MGGRSEVSTGPTASAGADLGVGSGVPRRVLTISADMGGGHNATAAALEEAVRALWPASEIQRLDTLSDLLPARVGNLFRRIYITNVEKTPWLYEFFYSSLWRHRWFARASKAVTGFCCAARLTGRIDRFDPDLILSTYPLATSGLAWLRRHRGLSVPCAAWISDFAPHPFWVYRDIDANFVMHEVCVPHARAAEPEAVIEVCRPPVVQAFTPGARSTARSVLGLRADAFVVLVTCGAYAFGDITATVRALLAAATEVQVVAACGRNDTSRARLTALGEPDSRLLALGWTENMADYVRAADIVLTNAGGASALESLACARPILMSRPIAAHGAANAQLMVVSGLADVCADEERLLDYVRTAVADPDALAAPGSRAGQGMDGRDLRSILAELAAPRHRPPAPARPWPLRSADAFFAQMDTVGVRQEIGALVDLGPVAPGRALDRAALERVLAERAPGLPALRRRFATSPPRRGRSARTPRYGWWLEEEIDVSRHVSEAVVPPHASEAEVQQRIDDFWSEPLPADRPPWQILLLRGRADGRAILAVKMHHALGDGISALGMLDRLLLTAAPEDKLIERRALDPAHPAPREVVARLGRVVRGLGSLATRGAPPRHPLNHCRQVGESRGCLVVPLPAAELRAAARRLHAQPHELVLAVLAAGFGDALGDARLSSSAQTLRVMVPMAARAARLDRVFGNWTGAAALDLPIGPMLPSQRVAAIRTELRLRLRRGEPEAAQFVMDLAGRLPAALHARFARFVYTRRFFSSIASYMPGPLGARCCEGAPVHGIYPLLPLTAGVPVTLGAILAADTIGVGVLYDPSFGLDRTELAAAVLRAFEAAVAEAGPPRAQRPEE